MEVLAQLASNGFDFLLNALRDASAQVRHTTAWTIGKLLLLALCSPHSLKRVLLSLALSSIAGVYNCLNVMKGWPSPVALFHLLLATIARS